MICIRIDDLMPEMRNAIQQLEVKQISDIINVQSMHYIIQRMKLNSSPHVFTYIRTH